MKNTFLYAKLLFAFLTSLLSLPLSAQTITTIAGNGSLGFSGDGGVATAAQFNNPRGVAIDRSGNVYISDVINNRIRKVTPSGLITTFAGTGSPGYSGDGGAATAAQFHFPEGIATDSSGNLYIADMDNHRIRKVNSSGIIITVAGTGAAGFSGDGGAATAAKINSPRDVAVDDFGNLYISDMVNYRVRKVLATGIISTIAGTGTPGYSGDGGTATSARFNALEGIAADRGGNVYIVDINNQRIRKINSSGTINTIAGTGATGFSGDGWAATSAQLYYPWGIVADGLGNIYISDNYNSRIRKVDLYGMISTFAGSGSSGFSGDGGAASAAVLASPIGISLDTAGNIYFVDGFRIRKISACPFPVVAHITGRDTLCLGTPISLHNTASGGLWTSGATGIATVNSVTGVVGGVTTGTVVISYSVANSCGTTTVTKLITVDTIFSPGIISGTTALCRDSMSILTTSGTIGGIWSSSAAAVATVNDSGAVTGVSGGTSIISYTVSNTCGSSTAVTTVTITPAPNPGVISDTNVLCVGNAVTLTTTGATGGTWSSSSPAVASVNSSGVVTGMSGGSVTITYAVTNSCGTLSTTHSMSIVAAPATSGIISGTTTICSGAATALSSSVSGGSWGSTTIHATVNSTGVVTGLSAGVAVISYTLSNACGSASATISITVNSRPHAGPLTGSTSICPGGSSSLVAATSGGNWSSSNISVASVDTAGAVTAITAGTSIISYIAGNTCGADTASIVVTVNPLPTVASITGIDSVCPAASVILSNTSTGGSWVSGNTSIAIVSSGGVVLGVSPGAVSISYTVGNTCGTATATYPFTVLGGASCPSDVVTLQSHAGRLEVYPNPNNGLFSLRLSSPGNDNGVISITNILGQKISEFTVHTNQEASVSLSAPSGLYFLTAQVNGERHTVKILIEQP